MARYEQVTCDVCGTQKQTANHWFVIVVSEPVSTYDRWISLLKSNQSYTPLSGDVLFDVCGEACVLKKVSELISK